MNQKAYEKRSKTRGWGGESRLLKGFRAPIRTGWRLWARSIRDLCLYTAPLAFVMGLWVWLVLEPQDVIDAESLSVLGSTAIFLLLTFAFGIGLTQVILSQQYTGLVKGNLYWWTLRRFIPWVLTSPIALAATFLGLLAFIVPHIYVALRRFWADEFALAATFLGLLAFIVPGIYVALRLFWADEFALLHSAGPFDSLKNSWQLTRGNVGSIFGFQFLAGLTAQVVLIGGGIVLELLDAAVEFLGNPEFLGLVALAVSFLVIFVGYGALHGPEIVYFYGMRTDQSRSIVRSTKVLDK